MNVEELLNRARAVKAGEARDHELRMLMDEPRFPALLSLVLEFEEDLARSVSGYDRSAEERTMDAGGLATIRKLRETFEGLLLVPEKDVNPPPAIGTEEKD